MPVPVPSPAVGATQISAAIPPLGSIQIDMAMSSPPFRGAGGGGMAPVLEFNGYGDLAGLLYHSPHIVVYEEDLYPTALHLFEARKFLGHRPDLAEQVRRCKRVEDVTSISAQLEEFTRRDWGNIALVTVSTRILYCACFWLVLIRRVDALDGRSVIPQVPAARRPVHAAS